MTLEREIGEMRAGIDALRDDFRQHRDDERRWREDLAGQLCAYSKRIRVLERWRDAIGGAVALLAVIWAVVRTLWTRGS